MRTAIELLMVLIQILSGRNPGGQPGRVRKTLQPVVDPDAIQRVKVDRRTLPKGGAFRVVGFEKHQVVDLDIRRFVTEYQAEILENTPGATFCGAFSGRCRTLGSVRPAAKAHAVYLSQYPLLPYDSIREYFEDQVGIPLSVGSLFNFNQDAFNKATEFEPWVKDRLAEASVVHADETGVNIGGKRHWLHGASNNRLTWLAPHAQRGQQALDAIGILPCFNGVLCHDH